MVQAHVHTHAHSKHIRTCAHTHARQTHVHTWCKHTQEAHVCTHIASTCAQCSVQTHTHAHCMHMRTGKHTQHACAHTCACARAHGPRLRVGASAPARAPRPPSCRMEPHAPPASVGAAADASLGPHQTRSAPAEGSAAQGEGARLGRGQGAGWAGAGGEGPGPLPFAPRSRAGPLGWHGQWQAQGAASRVRTGRPAPICPGTPLPPQSVGPGGLWPGPGGEGRGPPHYPPNSCWGALFRAEWTRSWGGAQP